MLLLLLAAVVHSAFLSGCRSAPAWEGPRVYSIGRQATLSYETNRELVIPVEGKKLTDGLRFKVDVTLAGTRPINTNDYVVDKSPTRHNVDVLNVVLSTNYLERVKTGDILDVAVHVHEFNPAEAALGEIARGLEHAKDSVDQEDFQSVFAATRYLTRYLEEQRAGSNTVASINTNLEQLRLAFERYQSNELNIARARAEANTVRIAAESAQQAAFDEISRRLTHASGSEAQDLRTLRAALAEPALKFEQSNLTIVEPSRTAPPTLQDAPWLSAGGYETLRQELEDYRAAVARAKVVVADMTALELDARANRLELEKRRRRAVEDLNAEILVISDTIGAAKARPKRSKTERTVATASRTFTFYEFNKYREEYHAKRVLPANIMAFPEPEDEARKLFGPQIADHYFVVRLSLRNTESEDRLVSTGMIRARGRALVEPATGEHERFTVPVEVAPHSVQQVYTVLTDNADRRLRSFVFRTFELAGAIASAYTLSFNSAETVKDAIQLSTAVGVPAFGKFWTDRLPGYQRNVVTFAMDDLVKVPKGGVTAHKFLFFPKDAVEGIIIDQHSHGRKLRSPKADPENPLPENLGLQHMFSSVPGIGGGQPQTSIAYLVIDNLEVPFENVFQPETGDPRQRVLDLQQDVQQQIRWRNEIRQGWLDPAGTMLLGQKLAKAEFIATNPDTAAGIIAGVSRQWSGATSPALPEPLLTKATNAVSDLEALVDLLAPAHLGQNGLLLKQLDALTVDKSDLETIGRALMSGKPGARYASRLDDIEARVQVAKATMRFYEVAAELLADRKLLGQIRDHLLPTTPKEERARFEKVLGELQDWFQRLEAFRGKDLADSILPEISLRL